MRLKHFVTSTITPAVLILGVLALALVHFRNTLSLAQQSDQLARGVVAYSSGQLQLVFQRDSGEQRPLIRYGQQPVVQYTEWSSSVVVDGQVYSLWDEQHGYSFDGAEQRVFSTITGQGWQVIQISTVSADAITVAYSFDYLGPPTVPPREVSLILIHEQSSWLNPIIAGTTFRAGLTSTPIDDASTTASIRPQWRLTMWLELPSATHADLRIGDLRSAYDPLSGASQTRANQLTTTYTLSGLQPNVLVPVATEHVSVAPVANSFG